MLPTLRSNPRPPPAAQSVGVPRTRPLVPKRTHRRGPYACDECRLRKRACDAAHPCGPCHRSETDCTYAFRKPVPRPTARIRILQNQLRQARAWLKHIQDATSTPIHGLDMGQCLHSIDSSLRDDSPPASVSPHSAWPSADSAGGEAPRSLLTGHHLVGGDGDSASLYGAGSDVSFISMSIDLLLKQQSHASMEPRLATISALVCRPMDMQSLDGTGRTIIPTIPDDAARLANAVFDGGDLIMCFLPREQVEDLLPSAGARLPLTSRHAALLHVVLALGYIHDPNAHRGHDCDAAVRSATRHLHYALMLNQSIMTQDLTSLIVLLGAVVFFLSTYRTTLAYTWIGNACSMAIALGLFSPFPLPLDTPRHVRRLRSRLFASTLAIDRLISLILDLPPSLQQEWPSQAQLAEFAEKAEADDDLPTSALLRQAILLHIPLSSQEQNQPSDERHGGSFPGLRKAQAACQHWKDSAFSFLAKLDQYPEHLGIKHDLEVTFGLCQIIMFRPHLYHVRDMYMGKIVSVAESHHALACIKVASFIIRMAESAQRGSFLSIYAVFSSVICLAFLVAAHPATTLPSIAWQRACTGTRFITAHKCLNNAAFIYLEILRLITSTLRETIYIGFDSIEADTPKACQRTSKQRIVKGKSSAQEGDSLDNSLRMAHIVDEGVDAEGFEDFDHYWNHLVLDMETTADVMSELDETLSLAIDPHDVLGP